MSPPSFLISISYLSNLLSVQLQLSSLFLNLVLLLAYGLLIGGFFGRTCIPSPLSQLSFGGLWCRSLLRLSMYPVSMYSHHVSDFHVLRPAPMRGLDWPSTIIYVYTPITNVLLWEEQLGSSITPGSYQG